MNCSLLREDSTEGGRKKSQLGSSWGLERTKSRAFFLPEWALPFPSRKAVFLSCDLGFARLPLDSAILEATYLVQTKDFVQICANLLNKVSKNSEKNHECASQITSSIYKISWSNSSYSRSYKKDKFEMHLNHYCCQKICLFCNF